MLSIVDIMSNTYTNPYTSSTRWLRGNVHAHTCCGRVMDLAVSGAMYKGLGYDFLAVTDHNRTHDEAQIAKWAAAAEIIVVPGEENGSTDHIIELGVHTAADTGDATDFLERAEALHRNGGFVIACHPQEYAMDGRGERNVERSWQSLDAIEVFNGLREARGTDELRNIALWDRILTAGGKIWAIASDDFHCQHIGPGRGWVRVQIPEDAEATWQLIVSQLKKGAFYATTYPEFESIQFDDNHLSVSADRHTKEIRVIGPGGGLLAAATGRQLEWQVVPGLPYFRIEAISGNKRAWSQPFFRC